MTSIVGHDVKAISAANRVYEDDRAPRALAYLIVAAIALASYCAGFEHGAHDSAQASPGGGPVWMADSPPNP